MHPRRPGRAPAIGVALGLMILAGCGAAGADDGGTPTPGTPTPGTPTPGPVTVTADKQQYGPKDTIAVTITNGLSSSIVAPDHQSNCTTVTLEWWSGANWQPQNPCKLMTPTRLIPISAGATMAQHLQPQGGTPPGWPTGTYRVAFTYYVGTLGSHSGSPTTIYSATFTVG
jgi:hypothetical protein